MGLHASFIFYFWMGHNIYKPIHGYRVNTLKVQSVQLCDTIFHFSKGYLYFNFPSRVLNAARLFLNLFYSFSHICNYGKPP